MSRSDYFKTYYATNRERIKAASAARRMEKPEECRAAVDKWHKDPANAERKLKYAREVVAKSAAFKRAQKAYMLKNTGYATAKAAARRLSKLQRTPKWLSAEDRNGIACLYQLASVYSRSLGAKFEVDHSIPLKGSIVSGLHVPSNLEIIERRENRAKSNRFIHL